MSGCGYGHPYGVDYEEACLLCQKRRADRAEAALTRILRESSDGEAMLIAAETLGISIDRTES